MDNISYANTRRIRAYCEARNDYRLWYLHLWACALGQAEWDRRFGELMERLQ